MDRMEWLEQGRLTVIVGYSGSGKTEFSVNLALTLARRGKRTALADLDVVNPYFRSRERRELLARAGVRLIATSQACVDADVPAMPAEVNVLFQDPALWGVLDIGGGGVGARVLARYRPQLLGSQCRVLFVLNARRPQTRDVEGALASLEEIRAVTGLPVDGLVDNTHLCRETERADLEAGAALAKAVSSRTGLPVVCHVVQEGLLDRAEGLPGPWFPVRLYMNRPWEMDEEKEECPHASEIDL